MSLVISTFSDRWWGNARSFMQWQGTKSGNIIWYHGTWLPEDHGCSTAHVLDTWTSCSTELLAQWGDDLRLRKEIKVSWGFSLHGMSFPVYIIVQFQLNKRFFFYPLGTTTDRNKIFSEINARSPRAYWFLTCTWGGSVLTGTSEWSCTLCFLLCLLEVISWDLAPTGPDNSCKVNLKR